MKQVHLTTASVARVLRLYYPDPWEEMFRLALETRELVERLWPRDFPPPNRRGLLLRKRGA